ncbi:hypothetical protein ACFFHP_16515, partial [Glutamicibacter ardleyensis]
WERKVTIPQGAASGAWEVSLFPLNDVMGNSGNGFLTLGIVNIESSVSDVSAPVLRNYSVSPLNHNLSDGPAEITIRATITDATGTQAPTLSVSHDSGQSYGFGSMTLVSGSAKDGTWERKVTIPQGAASGAWEVSLFPLNDVMGNSGNGFRTLGIVNILDQVELKELGAPVPEISGIAKIGSTLSVSAGTWAPSGAALKYQWERNGVSIEGATKPTYTLAITDAGQKITVTVTGSKSGYKSVSKTSAATAIPLMSLTETPVPQISGTAKVGSTLNANTGTWAPSGAALKYQWERNGVSIEGATKPTYTLAITDAGQKITVTVTGSKSGYKSVSKTSAATAIPLMSLTETPVPQISGTAKVGSTLNANTGTWAPSGAAFKYQWERNGVSIEGATKPTYTLAITDAGQKITVTVTGSKSGYKSVSKTSAATAIPLMSLTGTPVPKVSGTAKVGSTLKANAGTWKPATVTLKYQWKRDGKTITGATKTSYKLVAADAGKKITVTITGSKSGYKSVSKTSAATAIPLMSLTGTPVPKVSGTAKVGSTLKANAGTWKPATVTLKYQWKRDGKTITGATKTSYKLAKSDKGRKVTVTTTGSKSGYKSVSKTSLAKLIK